MAERAWIICDSDGTRVQHYQESTDDITSPAAALNAYRDEFGRDTTGHTVVEVPAAAL